MDERQKTESARVYRETEIERAWWGAKTKFYTPAQAKQALKRGLLVAVPRNGGNYRLIGRLNGTEDGEPNLLRPVAQRFLTYALAKWREKLGSEFDNVRVAVTSLYRTAELQRALQIGSNGYRTVGSGESSHLAGIAIDISCRSYYLHNEGAFVPIQSWRPESGKFNPAIFDRLREVLEDLARRGLCNFVIENKIDEDGIEPSVYHICVSPSFGRSQ